MTPHRPKTSFEGPLGEVLRTSWGRPESASQGRPLNVTLGVHWTSFQGLSITSDRGALGWSNGIFRVRPVEVLGTNIWLMGSFVSNILQGSLYKTNVLALFYSDHSPILFSLDMIQ